VIYERCPLDFLAYLNALDASSTAALAERVSETMRQLDLIVYLPLDDAPSDDEFPKLRKAMDQQLSRLLTEANVTVVEATGSTAQRLRAIENAIE
jgi:tRNA nucleotidyltransferase (CCA-adding enzyme)